MRIGIDVGGTNTDAVLIDGTSIVASVKRATSADVTSGIVSALAELRRQRTFEAAEITGVMIGTTHFINALVQARSLAPTAAVRLGLPATRQFPPFTGWPARLVAAVRGRGYLAHGGHEFDGRVISPIDPEELKRHAADIAASGARSVAISSVFSPVNGEFEQRAADILAAELGGGVTFSQSREFGRIGLLERENATIINAALRELADAVVTSLAASVERSGIAAPLLLSQNDGTLMDLEYARRYPVATFASGPTNSMRGAAMLSGLENCAVIDVGGTTTDIGVITAGLPREAAGAVSVAGVRTSFRMPDVLSLGIGGGSVISADGSIVGPDSVGYRFKEEALIFGGRTFTATDAAVAAGLADIGDRSLAAGIPPVAARRVLGFIADQVTDAIERMHTSATLLPVVAVGGGSILLPSVLPGIGAISRPHGFLVANAVGAAIAQVSGEVDRVYALPEKRGGAAADEARQEAVDRAIAAGAAPGSVAVVDFDEVPVPYLPGNAKRIRVKAVGELAL